MVAFGPAAKSAAPIIVSLTASPDDLVAETALIAMLEVPADSPAAVAAARRAASRANLQSRAIMLLGDLARRGHAGALDTLVELSDVRDSQADAIAALCHPPFRLPISTTARLTEWISRCRGADLIYVAAASSLVDDAGARRVLREAAVRRVTGESEPVALVALTTIAARDETTNNLHIQAFLAALGRCTPSEVAACVPAILSTPVCAIAFRERFRVLMKQGDPRLLRFPIDQLIRFPDEALALRPSLLELISSGDESIVVPAALALARVRSQNDKETTPFAGSRAGVRGVAMWIALGRRRDDAPGAEAESIALLARGDPEMLHRVASLLAVAGREHGWVRSILKKLACEVDDVAVRSRARSGLE